jgi:YrbI family 3-deoxy-D-manno-octulosonate 8-phosphate phosphatase
MQTIAFIPARCGSKSIPFKNIKLFCGKPLIFWNLKAIEESNCIDKAVVATDCEEIEKTVKKYNFSKIEIYRRSAENAKAASSTESVILEYINKADLNEKTIFFLVQITSPFTVSDDFDNAYQKFTQENFDSLLTCVRSKRFFWNENGNPINYDYNNRPRRQNFGGTMVENGAFYVNTVGNILTDRNRLSGRIGIYEMPEYSMIELDEEDDWIIAESLMKKYVIKRKLKNLNTVKLILTDVDGVLTDAGMYYSEKGDEMKKFNTRDGMAFKILKEKNIKTGIITGEDTKLVQRRAKKLKADYLFMGIDNKLPVVEEICKKEQIDMQQIAYIGDDINDLKVLKNIEISATPADAPDYIKQHVNFVTQAKGGEGAFREFAEFVINNNSLGSFLDE